MERKSISSSISSGGHERRTHIEWHPFLADYFVAGAEELQLYEVVRQQQQQQQQQSLVYDEEDRGEGLTKYRYGMMHDDDDVE